MDVLVTRPIWINEWQLLPLIVLAGTAVVYLKGYRANHIFVTGEIFPARKKIFLLALILALIVLASPIHTLATYFFSIHVAQHILLMALIPCLIAYSNPIPILAAGLPKLISQKIDQLSQSPRGRTIIKRTVQVTSPGNVFVLATISFWIWYDPMIHQLTLTYRWLHLFETSWLFFVALLYWWHIMSAYPRLHQPLPPIIRILYTIIGTWPIKIVGLILLFSSQSVYDYPQSFQLNGLNINDQGFGAILVWSLGGVVFSTTAAMIARDWLGGEAVKPVDPAPAWQTERGMGAPGFNKVVSKKREFFL